MWAEDHRGRGVTGGGRSGLGTARYAGVAVDVWRARGGLQCTRVGPHSGLIRPGPVSDLKPVEVRMSSDALERISFRLIGSDTVPHGRAHPGHADVSWALPGWRTSTNRSASGRPPRTSRSAAWSRPDKVYWNTTGPRSSGSRPRRTCSSRTAQEYRDLDRGSNRTWRRRLRSGTGSPPRPTRRSPRGGRRLIPAHHVGRGHPGAGGHQQLRRRLDRRPDEPVAPARAVAGAELAGGHLPPGGRPAARHR